MNRLDPQTIVQAAELLLYNRFTTSANLAFQGICWDGDASLVIRAIVTAPSPELPDSIIIKIAHDNFGAYIPNSTGSLPATMLFNDWAAYEFLSSQSEFSGLSPQFYGGDRDHGFIILEDLGDSNSPNTYDNLLGSDQDRALETLFQHVSQLGRLHAHTQGHQTKYRTIRQSLGPLPLPDKPFKFLINLSKVIGNLPDYLNSHLMQFVKLSNAITTVLRRSVSPRSQESTQK